jgi:YVTN family beta-propeller protein
LNVRFLLLIFLAVPALAQFHVYVADSGDNRISIIDPQTRKVSGEIHVSPNPGSMAASADGLRLYVISGTRNALDIIDVKTLRVVRSITVGPQPAGIAVSSDGRRAFVCVGSGVDVIDTASFTRVKSIPAGRGMQNIYLTPDQTRMIATSTAGKNLTVINARTEQVEFEIPTGGEPGEIAIDADRNLVINRVFVQLAGDPEMIDCKTRRATGKLAAPPGALAESPDRKALWAGGVVFSLPDLKRTATYSTGGFIAFTPDGRRSYISNPDSDSVSVIDTLTYKELARIPVGAKPEKIVVIE